MNPTKAYLKLAKLNSKAQLCTTREAAQKYIRKADKLQAKIQHSH